MSTDDVWQADRVVHRSGRDLAFGADVLDYAVGLGSEHGGRSPRDDSDRHVRVRGGCYPLNGIFGELVSEQVGQRFTIVVTTDTTHDGLTHYHVGRFPPDCPPWSAQRSGTAQAEFDSMGALLEPAGDHRGELHRVV